MSTEKFKNNCFKKYMDLTALLTNNNYIINFLQDEINNINVDKYSLFIVDIDDFRFINDFRGYIFGNKILEEVAKRLNDISYDDSIVIYSGANRFLIFNFTIVDLEKFADKILNVTRKEFSIENFCANLTTSIGVYDAYKHEELDIVLQNADIALNKAKVTGKDCFAIFNDAIKYDLIRNTKIQNNLRKAIKNQNLEIYYQPKIHTENEELIGAEALLRWNDEELGSISPLEFIEIAERTGIIIELGRYVINKVCQQINQWEKKNIKYKNIAVNLSAKQFKDTYLPEYISNILREYELPPSVLELEVTESSIIENIKCVDKMLNEFIKKDIKISIDDFGTGYSSYNHLSDLSLNTLKIDKSFIDFINFNSRKNLIVKNIIDFAHILDMEVVAEGVEHEHQMKTLKDYGCDIIQGYYYSKPLCVQDFEEYIMKKEGEI